MKASQSLAGKGDRILWLDVFRAFLIFAIAMGHAVSDASRPGIILNEYLYSFHVPAFFMVSGFLFGKKKEGFLSFALKRARGLLVPYLIFAVISVLIFALLGSFASDGIGVAVKSTGLLPSVIGMLYASGISGYMAWNLPLWFLPCLFLMSCVFWFVRELVDVMRRRIPEALSFGIVLAVFFALSFVNYYFLDIKGLPFGAEIMVCQMPFFMAGYLMREKALFDRLGRRARLVCGAVFVLLGFLPLLWTEGRADPVHSIYGNLFGYYTFAFITSVGYMLIFSAVKSPRWLSYMGRNTLSILVMHKFPIVFCQILVGGIMAKNGVADIVLTVVISAAACLLSLLAGHVISLVCPFALGLSKKRARRNDRRG